jgi:2-dehydropantoate 2-reductase
LNIYDLRQAESRDQHIVQDWRVSMREELPADHDYDMIFVSTVHYQISQAVGFLSTRLAKATAVMFSNFWEDPQALAAGLPQAQLAWGFPGAGGGFQRGGELYGALFPKVEFGTFGSAPSEREILVRKTFAAAGFTVVEHRNFRDWLWVHFAVAAAITAQQVRTGASRRAVYENRDRSMEEAVRNVREIMPLLAARGVPINDHPELTFFNQPEAQVAESLAALLRGLGFQAAIDGHSNPEELQRMFSDVLATSRKLGVPTPRLEAASSFMR